MAKDGKDGKSCPKDGSKYKKFKKDISDVIRNRRNGDPYVVCWRDIPEEHWVLNVYGELSPLVAKDKAEDQYYPLICFYNDSKTPNWSPRNMNVENWDKYNGKRRKRR